MKAYAVDCSLHSPRLSFFHYLMFHGQQVHGSPYWRLLAPCLGDDMSKPLYLIRNARQVPAVFSPVPGLVVSEQVKGKLEELPHIAFLPVHFHKVVNFPVYPPGVFSFRDNPEFQKILGRANIEKFLERLPDVPELHGTLGQYYELVLPRLSDVASKYSSVNKLECSMTTPSRRSAELTLSADLLWDYPAVWWYYKIFSDSAFSLISPYLDRDYFEVAELEV